ncbi:MAG: efflux RND transporter periplasmic adaptor subunit [Myxococcales bacterium]|nr:efflux RND transporter periplasmic adaptor subunit [Myxococcales bacterium]
MKRFALLFVILIAGLSAVLYRKLQAEHARAEAPAGGGGTVEATRVDVAPRLGARIRAIHARAGDAVKAGQLLVELDCTEPEAAQAEARAAIAAAEAVARSAAASVGQAEAMEAAASAQAKAAAAAVRGQSAHRAGVNVRRKTARADGRPRDDARGRRGRHRQPARRGADGRGRAAGRGPGRGRADRGGARRRGAASAQVSAAEAAVQIARARSEAATQDVARAQAALRRADALAAECRLVAPVDALVQTRAAEPGELARPGFPLLILLDLRRVTATFYLPNAELAAAQPGMAVEVTADAWPDRRFQGSVSQVGLEAEFTPRNVQTREDRDRLVYPVEVALENPDGALRPGMPVEVALVGTGGRR